MTATPLLLATFAFIGALLLVTLMAGTIRGMTCAELYSASEQGSALATDLFTQACKQP